MRISPPAPRRLIAWSLVAGFALAVLGVGVGAASPALAHDSIVSSNPSSGETVTQTLSAVRLTFSDDLTALDGARTATIWVTDEDGGHHESGCVTLNGAVAMTQVALGEAGDYEVAWQVVSSDGHLTEGSYSFTWRPAAVTMAAPAFDSAPNCGDDWSGQQQSTTPTMSGSATPSPEESGAVSADGSTPDAAPAVPVTPTSTPEPTMTIMSAAPAAASDTSSLAVPIAIAVAIAGLAAVAAVVVSLMRRAHGADFGRRKR